MGIAFARWSIMIVVLMFVCCLATPVRAFWDDPNFDRVVEQLAEDLVESGKLKGVAVLVAPQDLYDVQTRLSLPFANPLRSRLVTELTRAGVRVLSSADSDAIPFLQGAWSRQRENLALDLKVMAMGKDGPEVRGAASGNLPLKLVDPAALIPDRNSWALYLVRQLGEKLRWQSNLSLYLRPFKSGGQRCSSELGSYLAGWLRPALAESGIFRPVDPRDAMGNVGASTLRTRGITRGIYPTAGNGQSLTGSLTGADADLLGEVWPQRDKVELRATLVDRDGRQLSAASVDVPVGLFPAGLFEPDPVPVNVPLSVAQLTSVCVTGSGLALELTTTHGESRPTYRKGEKIRFVLRLNRPAWVYLFDLNPAGEAILLYPVDGRGRLARDAGFLREINKPLILPEDGYSFDLVVDAPFGTDTVWAVASEAPLDFPVNLVGDWARAENLVARLREQGTKGQRGYAEGKLELVTVR